MHSVAVLRGEDGYLEEKGEVVGFRLRVWLEHLLALFMCTWHWVGHRCS